MVRTTSRRLCHCNKGLLLQLDRTENSLRDDLLSNPSTMDGCYALVPSGPGLGVRVDEREMERVLPVLSGTP
jgi:L-alanine-DL-glutamate epimerase-like enolase superfamily enzyme